MSSSGDHEEIPGLAPVPSVFNENDDNALDPLLAAQYGLAVNELGRVYKRGNYYETATKLLVHIHILFPS